MTLLDRKSHRVSFLLKVDGLPFLMVERLNPTTLTVAISGDLNSGGEYMRCFVNGTQIGGDLATGFQDSTFRDIITDENVEDLIGENPVVELSGFGSSGVTPGVGTNSMRFTFTDPLGSTYVYTLLNVENGSTVTESHPVMAQSVCLTDNAIQVGSENIDLNTMSGTGSSGSVTFRASKLIKPYINKLNKENLYVAADATDSSSTITCNRAVANFDDKILFSGGETLFVSSVSGDVLTVSRGLFDSTAEAHYGGSSFGEQISSHVPGWTGRNVGLYVRYLNNENQFSEAASLLKTMRVDDSPAYRNADFFDLAVADLTAFFIDRKAMSNMDSVFSNTGVVAGESSALVFPSEQGLKLTTKGNVTTFAWITLERRAANMERGGINVSQKQALVAYTVDSAGQITVDYYSDLIGDIDASQILDSSSVAVKLLSAKQVYPVRGNPVVPVLQILNSGGTGGSYASALPKAPATTELYDSEWRMGAAIDGANIDEASFLSVQNRVTMPWSWMLYEELTVGQLLSWLCSTAKSFWFVSDAGKITLKKFDAKHTENTSSNVATLNNENILLASADSSSVSEKSVAGSYRVKTNYSWEGEPLLEVNFTDFQTKKIYPNAENVVEFDYPFLVIEETSALSNARVVSGYNPINRYILEQHIRRKMKLNSKGLIQASVTCGWSTVGIALGDYVSFSNDAMFEYGSAALRWLIIGKQIDYYGGTVQFEMVGIETGRIIGVAGEVSVWTDASKKVTFNASDPEWGGGNPSDYFTSGQEVRVYDVSGSTFTTTTITSIPNVVEIVLAANAASLGFTPVAGDIISTTLYQSALTDEKENYLFQCDDGTLGPSEEKGSRFN